MRCAHVEVDGAHADAAGANGKGVNVDGARDVGMRGANVDWGVIAGVWWMVQPMVCVWGIDGLGGVVDGVGGKVNDASGTDEMEGQFLHVLGCRGLDYGMWGQ